MQHANHCFLLPAPKRVILAVVQQSQRLYLRRHQDDHQFFSWMTVRHMTANPGDHRCRRDGRTFAFSCSAECNEPSRDSISEGKKGNP